MSDNDVYNSIAEMFEYRGSNNFVDYLHVLFTPEEGKFLLELTSPVTCQQLAERLKVDEKSLYEKLEGLRRRRLLYKGKSEYLFHIGIHGFFARVPIANDKDIPPGYLDAWNKFMPEVEKRMIDLNIKMDLQAPGIVRERILPARLAIASNPNIRPEQILWYEDVHEMLRRKGKEGVIGVFDCPCRRRAHNCDKPIFNCFEFGAYAEFNLNQDSRMKKISVDEAIAISDEAEKAGLVHNAPGNYATGMGNVLCNCCECCCNVMGAFIRFARAHEQFSPSRYRPTVNEELCNGCQDCVERCPYGAIEIRKTANSKRFKAHIMADKCMGCGACVLGCQQNALIFELVKPVEHIPLEPPSIPIILLPGISGRSIINNLK